MDINKIEIDIKNTRYFADVAILADRPDFIKAVNQLRTKWKIENNFKDEVPFLSHIKKLEKERNLLGEFDKDIKKLRLEYNRSSNFDGIIFCAVAFGRVFDGVYNPCYYEKIKDTDDPDNELKYKYAIIVTPNTVLEDINPVLEDIKTRMKKGLEQKKDKKKMDASLTDYSFELGPQYSTPSRKVENIVRDREWYWFHKKMSYSKVLKKALEDGEVITKDGVIKAIISYEQRLKEL